MIRSVSVRKLTNMVGVLYDSGQVRTYELKNLPKSVWKFMETHECRKIMEYTHVYRDFSK